MNHITILHATIILFHSPPLATVIKLQHLQTQSRSTLNVNCCIYIWLSAKRCANGGSDFWLSIKSVSNTLSCCCFVCAFIIGQYHSGNNMSSKSGAAGEILFFESEKRHEIRPLKMDTLTMSGFDAFIHIHDESKHYLSHRFAQRRYRLHSAYKIDYH